MKRLVLAIMLASLAVLAPCGEPSRAQAPDGGEGCHEIVADGPPDAGLRDTNINFRVKHAPQSLRGHPVAAALPDRRPDRGGDIRRAAGAER